MDIVNSDTLKKTITKLYYKVTSCSDCISLMQKSNLQKPSNIPHLIDYKLHNKKRGLNLF